MANYFTRIVRVYQKKQSKKIPVSEICNSLARTALFENELIWNLNKEKGHLDIKWNSKRGGGDLGIDFKDFDVWEIKSDERNQITFNQLQTSKDNYNELFFFAFDEIQVKSNNEIINKEYFRFINHLKAMGRAKIQGDKALMKISGCYDSNCGYEIGELIPNQNRTREVNIEEFLQPRGDFISINQILSNEFASKELNNFLKFVSNHHEPDFLKHYNGFESIKFLWKNRIVNEIYKSDNPYDIWQGRNSDWWDNCILPNWIEYKIRKEYA